MQPLAPIALSILKTCLGVKHQETVLILSDESKLDIGIEFYKSASPLSRRCFFISIPTVPWGYEPPKPVASFLEHADVGILVTGRSLSHTKARRRASRKGARIVSMPGVTADSLVRTMDVNWQHMGNQSRKIADIFTIGTAGRLTTPSGTDLVFSLARMKGYADTGLCLEPGQFSNIPAGEGCASPAPHSAHGTLVIDGSFPEIGKLGTPVRLMVKQGYVASIAGGAEAERVRRLLRPFGRHGKAIAEIGVGTNPKAKLTGTTLEDEKVLGTVHVALGNNLSFGGNVVVHCHFDGVLLKPTLTVDGKKVVDNGLIQV